MRRLLAALFLAVLAGTAHAQTPNEGLTPTPIQHFVDSNGIALVGGKLFTYAAGTTTKANTYTDVTGMTVQTNPIILNSRGEPEDANGNSLGIWIPFNTAFKFVLSPANDTDPPTNPIWTLDNIQNVTGSGGSVPACSSGAAGLVPPTGGGTTNFLRADCSFQPIPPPASASIACSQLTEGCPFDIVMFWPGTLPNNGIVRIAITRTVDCPVGFTGSVGIGREAATASAVINVNQVTSGTGTLRGTATWAASGTVATFASSGGMTLASGDQVEFAFPASADATLGDVAITLDCART